MALMDMLFTMIVRTGSLDVHCGTRQCPMENDYQKDFNPYLKVGLGRFASLPGNHHTLNSPSGSTPVLDTDYLYVPPAMSKCRAELPLLKYRGTCPLASPWWYRCPFHGLPLASLTLNPFRTAYFTTLFAKSGAGCCLFRIPSPNP